MKEINDDNEIRVLGGSNWKGQGTPRNKNRKKWIVIAACIAIAAAACTGAYLYIDNRLYGFEYPVSRSDKDVIESLCSEKSAGKPAVVFSEDSCLGVKMRFYKISGLTPELRDTVPPLSDENVYLVTRSSDYRLDDDKRKIIGDYVRGGKVMSKSNWRAGYLAILNGSFEIGISRRPDMRSFIIENKGSMFRQFALVSAGVACQSQFMLKGKVTRCAYVRMPDSSVYFVETVNPETLYGFADALVEYNAADAIYVTGGAQKDLFYRDEEGKAHGNYTDDKIHQIVVWTKDKAK